MLKNEWDRAATQVMAGFKGKFSSGPTGWKGLLLALTDEAGHDAAQTMYQSSSASMNRLLSSGTSASKHDRLAEYVIVTPEGRRAFARLRAIAWKRILNERIREMSIAAKHGDFFPLF